MLATPTKFTLCAGSAEGRTRLNAFDHALLAAGIGNLNLLKVSSILPPGARYVERLDVAPGSLVPTAYGAITSEVEDEVIAAAVGVGLSRDNFGVIMEFSGRCTKDAAEEEVLGMVRDAFTTRGMELVRTLVRGVEHRTRRVGCAFAAVALWY